MTHNVLAAGAVADESESVKIKINRENSVEFYCELGN